MSRNIHPVETLISPGDTRWAIAGKVPLSALERCRRELEDWLQGEGSKVVSGNDGFAALLVFGGPPEGESLAIELSRKHKTPIYVIDFNDELDEGLSIREFDGTRVKWKRGYPAAFLKARGVTPCHHRSPWGPLPPGSPGTRGPGRPGRPGDQGTRGPARAAGREVARWDAFG